MLSDTQPMLPTKYSSVLPISRIDLAPADTTATGVRPSSVKSALTSRAVKGQAALCWWLCCTPSWWDLTSQKARYAQDATAWLYNWLDPQANSKGLDHIFRCWDWKRYWQKEIMWSRAYVQPFILSLGSLITLKKSMQTFGRKERKMCCTARMRFKEVQYHWSRFWVWNWQCLRKKKVPQELTSGNSLIWNLHHIWKAWHTTGHYTWAVPEMYMAVKTEST